MHLCANVVWQRLLPAGTLVRRNFSFTSGEKGRLNILYRRFIDGLLARRHRMTDFFFSIEPLEPMERLQKVFSLANSFSVEVETHPIEPQEFKFLGEGKIFQCLDNIRIGRPSALFELPDRH
jgi:chitin disaccharide deacetylase